MAKCNDQLNKIVSFMIIKMFVIAWSCFVEHNLVQSKHSTGDSHEQFSTELLHCVCGHAHGV